MSIKVLLAVFVFSAIVAASPVPAQNVPITDAEWASLEANGLFQRDFGIQARDNVINCGKNILGTTTIGGNHIGWVPWDQFNTSAQQFCYAYAGSDISLGHESSDTYPIFLTNQDSPSIPGPSGNIAFAIYNTARSSTYHVDADTCYAAMQAPILAHLNKTHKNGKGDLCYGGVHEDSEGGYYFVEGIGAFGSEVQKA